MTTVATLLAVVGFLFCVVAGTWAVLAAWRGSAAVRRVLLAKRTRVVDLADGRVVEVSGKISFTGEGVVAPSGKRCAAARVTIRRGITKPENGTPHTFSRGAANAVLTDETGSVALDLADVEVVAPTYEQNISPRAVADASTWLAQMPEDVSHYRLLVAESLIEEGALVAVRGRAARLPDDVELTTDGGYRDVAPRRYRIVGGPDDLVLVTQGGTGKVLWRAGWPAFALFVFGAMFLTHAGVMAFLLLA